MVRRGGASRETPFTGTMINVYPAELNPQSGQKVIAASASSFNVDNIFSRATGGNVITKEKG